MAARIEHPMDLLLHPFKGTDLPVLDKDLSCTLLDATSLHFIGRDTKPAAIIKFKKVTWLRSKFVSQDRLNAIAELSDLQYCYLDCVTASDFAVLQQLRNLRFLSINGCTKTSDLDAFGYLTWLVGLNIADFPKVHSLVPLNKLARLKALCLANGIWNSFTLDSLNPLAEGGGNAVSMLVERG